MHGFGRPSTFFKKFVVFSVKADNYTLGLLCFPYTLKTNRNHSRPKARNIRNTEGRLESCQLRPQETARCSRRQVRKRESAWKCDE